ncbi:MAG: mitochondrial fission protein ELM1 [Gammaproteobacteria bacterium]
MKVQIASDLDPTRAAGTQRLADAPLCWCISKGMAGMNSQTRGLAEAVGVEYEMHSARMAVPWRWLPVAWVPCSVSTLRGLPALATSRPPRLVISCGRHGVVPALALKRLLGDQVFTVHVQDPKVAPALFDLVVVPRHDAVSGDNVYATMGAIHYVSEDTLAAARSSELAVKLRAENMPLVTVLLGGPNRYYDFTNAAIDQLVGHLRALAQRHQVKLVILGSNRTPPECIARMRGAFPAPHFVWDGSGENPYFSALACAEHIVVTGDSVSMVTEAAATGRPIFVYHLPQRRRSARFEDFHRMFADAGIIRPLTDELEQWCYEPPNDTPKIAAMIRERMGLC